MAAAPARLLAKLLWPVLYVVRLFERDRRWIFALLGLVVLVTAMVPLETPPPAPNPETLALYEWIESLPEGAPVMISFDFDPSSKPELLPAGQALLRHAFRRRLRVITLGLWPAGIGMAQEVIENEADRAREESGGTYPEYGEDYVFLGWQPGNFAVIAGLTENIQQTYARDRYQNRTADMPIWAGRRGGRVRTLADLSLVVTLSAGNPGITEWLRYGRGKTEFPLATATTAVTAPGVMPFYQSGQVLGMLGGMRGAAEYEALIHAPGDALKGMNVLSASHFLVVILVVLSNVFYFVARRRPRR